MCASRSAICRISVAVTIGLSIVASVAFSSDGDEEVRERVILMSSGRVLSGKASRNAGGWLVEQGNGRVQVPIEQVTFVARNLVDAYRQQRDSIIEPTPATHVALAQWCISFRLYDEARDELQKCLKLDPDHSSARKLLRKVESFLEPDSPQKPEATTPRTADGFLVPDVESLGGLSNETAAAFTQRIQPLLMNKCGNASCHGSAVKEGNSDRFHLIPVRNGANSSRLYTERNLAEVLRQIDIADPANSPLTTIPQGGHGGIAGIFNASNGNTQLKMLRAWTKSVAAEKQAEEEEIAARPTIAPKGRRPSKIASTPRPLPASDDGDFVVPAGTFGKKSSQVVTAAYTEEVTTPEPTNVAPSVPKRTAPPAGKQEATSKPESIKPDDRSPDAFDPDEFNKRFHGRRR